MVSPGGREGRFGRIYESYYGHITAYARRRVGHDDVEDVVAETFLVAWRRLDAVPSGEVALAWLYGVARRVVSQRRRASRRRDRLTTRLRGLRQDEEDVTVNLERLPEQELVRSVLAMLGEGDQEVLRLAQWEGLTGSELSVALGCSANAAAIRLHRAHRRFARALHSVETRAAAAAERKASK